jgi:hypothetical protein
MSLMTVVSDDEGSSELTQWQRVAWIALNHYAQVAKTALELIAARYSTV